MQLDMHYYGTYAMARAAGIKPEYAQIIATAAQYVDDSNSTEIELRDGVFLACSATAHHPVDAHNVDPHDQRLVWIPFHFLPGNQGNSLKERLVCQIDSDVAHQTINNALNYAGESYGPMLMGVVAHTYADTFSHYGFSGISSEINEVRTDSILPKISSANVLKYVKTKADDFFEKSMAGTANLLKLGHGGVATYPDRPYLRWDFHYSDGRHSGVRDNRATFLQACEKLHELFRRFGEASPTCIDERSFVPFEQIQASVKAVLAHEGTLDERIAAWQTSAAKGLLFNGASEIPAYKTDGFETELAQLKDYSSQEVEETFLFRFFQAAKRHRDFVLYELFPRHGLQVLLP